MTIDKQHRTASRLKSTSFFAEVPVEDAMRLLNSQPEGLSTSEAAKRLARHGPNTIPEKTQPVVLDILSRYWGVMPWLLEFTMVLSYALHEYFEAVIIFALLTMNAVIGFWNEHGARRALELLRKKLSVQVRVQRNSRWAEKDSSEIVPGDIVSIGLGEFVTADMKLLSDGEVSVDQSALTGESLPVQLRKSSVAYSGSTVRRGEAVCLVLNTGEATYFGRTVALVRTARSVSHQERMMLAVVKYTMYFSTTATILVVIDALVLRTPLVTILKIILVFLIGAVPVALPAVFTVVLTAGALDLARKKALVTKLSAIEDAASMTVLCLDKTGTITENRLSVQEPIPLLNYDAETVLVTAAMASSDKNGEVIDQAVLAYFNSGAASAHAYRRLSFTPFEPATKRTEAVVEYKGHPIRAVKGALQSVLAVCAGVTDDLQARAEHAAQALSEKGYRVLAVARSTEEDLTHLQLVGLLPLADPPRAGSKQAIMEIQRLGIQVKMLTGDGLPIAREIARQVAIGNRIIRMAELMNLAPAARTAALEENDGVAEIYPEDKYSIVKLLQDAGHVVGMTGDGVNDSPALKQAEVGIAMSNAADVSKAAASIVLTEPGIGAILSAIETSRKIYQRMLSWVINKVSKVVQFVGLLTFGFALFGRVLLSPLGMVLLVFANDFTTMSLAADNASAAASPNIWNIRKIMLSSLYIGLLLMVEGAFGVAIGRLVFRLRWDALQDFVMLLLVFTSQFKILIIRERRFFWSSMPGTALLATLSATLLLFTAIGTFGLVEEPLGLQRTAILLLFSGALTLSLDPLKAKIFRACEL